MTQILQPTPRSFNDLVFDHRNKAYGAYVLRRDYPSHVLLSLLLGAFIMASILAIPYISSLWKNAVVLSPTTFPPDETTYELKEIKQEQRSGGGSSKPPSGPTSQQGGIPLVVNEQESKLPPDDSNPVIKPGETYDPGDGLIDGPPGESGKGGGGLQPGNDPVDNNGTTMSPEVWPEFPGGEEALFRFLSTNIVYPERAKDLGTQGIVYLRFTIDQFGNVRDVTVERGIGAGCDEEAVRVVSRMPRWKPGKQGGRPVKVSFILPVKFSLT